MDSAKINHINVLIMDKFLVVWMVAKFIVCYFSWTTIFICFNDIIHLMDKQVLDQNLATEFFYRINLDKKLDTPVIHRILSCIGRMWFKWIMYILQNLYGLLSYTSRVYVYYDMRSVVFDNLANCDNPDFLTNYCGYCLYVKK
jgi:hypothetical protein